MTPYSSVFRHDPSQGLFGDCVRIAIASILNIHPKHVPHFFADGCDGETGWTRVENWCRERRRAIMFFNAPAELPIDVVLASLGEANPKLYYLLCGAAPSGETHCVVCCGTEIVHNPSGPLPGIVGSAHGVWLLVVFTSMDMMAE